MKKTRPLLTKDEALADQSVKEAQDRSILEIKNGKITYSLAQKYTYNWDDPEEWVRCLSVARWITQKGYPSQRIKLEVVVPRRTPSDFADIVIYRDDRCKQPFAVEECKAAGQSDSERHQGIEQAFGNANSLDAEYVIYNEETESILFKRRGYPSLERKDNRHGSWSAIPSGYGDISEYQHFAGKAGDIGPVKESVLEQKIKRAHSIIWAGGKRDPLTAFDEWSKLLFAKVSDERVTRSGHRRSFQVGSKETSTAVANRIHQLFLQACKDDPAVFPDGVRINLPDRKIFEVTKILQEISFTSTDVDTVGSAFENFFGSVFRGELGQYFTMRPIARFAVAMLDISEDDFTLDPTCGSGGFLLEVLLQVGHRIEQEFPKSTVERKKQDYATHKVFGIEIHDILARICKINLILHHDGHTNIEGDRSCLDSIFSRPRLNPPQGRFSRIVGNPPFGDEVTEGDEDHLGQNSLTAFSIASAREKVASEHVILERCVELLEPGGRLGLVLPDGVFNNQGELSNCPQMRRYLAKHGVFEAIVSLPDYAFRKSGAQNKTSILFYRKFEERESVKFHATYDQSMQDLADEDLAIQHGLQELGYHVFLAEANQVGYTSTGARSDRNDLYRGSSGGLLDKEQQGTILGEYRQFVKRPSQYQGRRSPDCMGISATALWQAHPSHRLDPKFFLFKREEGAITPTGWERLQIKEVMKRRDNIVVPADSPAEMFKVMTISQTGEIRPRQAGKGRNPPEWLGMYFEESSSTWYAAQKGDVVFSSIDLWKGCIAVVPPGFDGALVTKEFPIYQITDDRLDPDFVSAVLRSRYFQRAFRAITTGHSNRRRTQTTDFEELEIVFPPNKSQQAALIKGIIAAREQQQSVLICLKESLLDFSNLIDGRGTEELPSVEEDNEHSADNE